MLIKNICRALLITSIFSTATIDSYGKTEKTTSEKKGFFSKLKKNKSLGLKKGKQRLKKAKQIEKEETLKRAQTLATLMHDMADQLVSWATENTFKEPINLTGIDEFRILISGWICKIDTLRSRKELYKPEAYNDKTLAMLLDIQTNLNENNTQCSINKLKTHSKLMEKLKTSISKFNDCTSLLMAKKTLQAMEKDVCKYADSIVSATEKENIALEDFVGTIEGVYNQDGTLKDKWEIYKKENVAEKLTNHQQQIADTLGFTISPQNVKAGFLQLLNKDPKQSATKSITNNNKPNDGDDNNTITSEVIQQDKEVKKQVTTQPKQSKQRKEKKEEQQKDIKTPLEEDPQGDDIKVETMEDDEFAPQEINVDELPEEEEEDDDDIAVLNPSSNKANTITVEPKKEKSKRSTNQENLNAKPKQAHKQRTRTKK